MSEAKHTPGPWSVVSDGMASPKVVDGAGLGVCHTTYAPTGAEANARLIAAAPELLEALILMVRTHDEPPESLLQEMREQKWLEQARAAIAKATGGQA